MGRMVISVRGPQKNWLASQEKVKPSANGVKLNGLGVIPLERWLLWPLYKVRIPNLF